MSAAVSWHAALAIGLGLLSGVLLAVVFHVVSRLLARGETAEAKPAVLSFPDCAEARPPRNGEGFVQGLEQGWSRRRPAPGDGDGVTR